MPSISPPQSTFDIISAIARKDASTEDIAQALRNNGVSKLEDIIEHLRTAQSKHESAMQATRRPIDIRSFAVAPDYEPRKDSVHRAPAVPILIDRDLYDPKDIVRFNGQELHSVVAPDGKSLVAVTDRRVIGKWWELTYVNSILGSLPGGAAMNAANAKQSTTEPSKLFYFKPPEPICWYWEHPNREGSCITHGGNRGYADLTRIHSGAFGWGDSWNDRITSVEVINMGICVLHEHIAWSGSTLSIGTSTALSPEGPPSYPRAYISELWSYGWNDVASSVEGW